MKYFLSLRYWRNIYVLVIMALYRQNKNTFLGSLLSVLQPFIHIIVISYFFSFLLKQSNEIMVLNLVGAVPLWTFINSSIINASNSLTFKREIIKRTLISKTFFPVSETLVNLYILFYSLVAMYIAAMIFYPEKFSLSILMFPLLLLPLVISVLSVGIALAFMTPYIRDLPQIMNIILQIAYWTIPIIYPYSLVPDSKKFLFELNPLYLLIRPVQNLVIDGQIYFLHFFEACLVSVLVSGISYVIYQKCRKNVIYYL